VGVIDGVFGGVDVVVGVKLKVGVAVGVRLIVGVGVNSTGQSITDTDAHSPSCNCANISFSLLSELFISVIMFNLMVVVMFLN
jgi:hypothetical protein